eukprot:6201242-Pleurochrysis_carterae.AAC.4
MTCAGASDWIDSCRERGFSTSSAFPPSSPRYASLVARKTSVAAQNAATWRRPYARPAQLAMHS